ncbi:MAG: serine kinase [Candidatus Delongbacteria bacterium]|nr:serine kinase [Candidatus Delongbacteria bacterium]MCG2760094.1 serine kinase [Candidatus Delongbacteria bacterium]
MNSLKNIVQDLSLKVVSGDIEREVSGGYSSDLLSDVIANAQKDDIWITLQTHVNIVAVANLKELAGIILVNGRQPEDATLNKAKLENILIMLTELPTFEIVGKLYEMGIHGKKRK